MNAGELADLLRSGRLRAVYHGGSDRLVLKELTRTYENLVEDSVHAMLRMNALFRAAPVEPLPLYAPVHSPGSDP